MRSFAHVMAFDDAPFERAHRGDVPVVGIACSGLRVDGVVSTRIRRDGANATKQLARAVRDSRFSGQTRLVMLQGIALGGFNVVDLAGLSGELGLPVLVVARKRPDLRAIRDALLTKVPGGQRKWRLIEQAGEMEPCAGLFVQRAGMSLEEAGRAIESTVREGRMPEPLRLAHLVAGGVYGGHSRGRA